MITVLSYSSMPFEFEIFETDATKDEAFQFVFDIAKANYDGENSNPIFDDFGRKHIYKPILSSIDGCFTSLNIDKIKTDVKIDFDEMLSLCDDIYTFKAKCQGV